MAKWHYRPKCIYIKYKCFLNKDIARKCVDLFPFFSYISRMKYIARWALMRNSVSENIQEHSHMAAVLAHALGVIRRDVMGEKCNPEAYATAALFHDAPEIFTGDMPTPIKYDSPEIREAYHKVEKQAAEKLLVTLPEELRQAYAPLLREEDLEVKRIVKAADKLSAYIKCLEELKAGNREFSDAANEILKALQEMKMEEVDWFLDRFADSFGVTLDRLQKR